MGREREAPSKSSVGEYSVINIKKPRMCCLLYGVLSFIHLVPFAYMHAIAGGQGSRCSRGQLCVHRERADGLHSGPQGTGDYCRGAAERAEGLTC